MACTTSVRDRQLTRQPYITAAQGKRALADSSRLIHRIIRANLHRVVGGGVFAQRLTQVVEQSTDVLGLLPLLTCQAVSGKTNHAIPVLAAWRVLRLSAKLLDDAADGDGSCTTAEAIGLATSYLFLAPLALADLNGQAMPLAKIERLATAFQGAALRASAGQRRGLSKPSCIDPAGWLDIALCKSGEPCAWAAWAGAFVGGANKCRFSAFHEYGMHLGVLLQVADDFGGIWQRPNRSDLRSGQLNLACCYARLVAQGEQRVLLESLLRRAEKGDTEAETQLQEVLTDLGSQAYLLVVANEQRQKAQAALHRAGIADGPLTSLLDQIWPALVNLR